MSEIDNDYKLHSLFVTLAPDNFLQTISDRLEFFYTETDPYAKDEALTFIKTSLSQFQKSYPDSDISPLLEKIIINSPTLHKSQTIQSIVIGLDAIAAGPKEDPTLEIQCYFNWVVDTLACDLTEPVIDNKLTQRLALLSALERTVAQRPNLCTPEYFELCCGLTNIRYRLIPIIDPNKPHIAPHEKTRRERLTKENDSVRRIHAHALNSVLAIATLFSKKIKALNDVRNRKYLIIEELRQIETSEKELESQIKTVFSYCGIKAMREARELIASDHKIKILNALNCADSFLKYNGSSIYKLLSAPPAAQKYLPH